MSNARLDQTKLPSDLWARRIWVPLSGGKPPLVEVTDRKRLMVGGKNKPDLKSMRGTKVK